jgi:hypothetical protein
VNEALKNYLLKDTILVKKEEQFLDEAYSIYRIVQPLSLPLYELILKTLKLHQEYSE